MRLAELKQPPPWPRSLEWRAVRDRVRLVRITHMDIGPVDSIVLDLAIEEAAQLLSMTAGLQLLAALSRARCHGRPANDPGKAA